MEHIHLQQCESTQSEMLKLDLKSPQQYLISTDIQTMGRGRRNNIWESNSNSLCFSLCLEPHEELTLSSAEISVYIAQYYNLKVKWPNDLLNYQGEKCGGILIQKVRDYLIVGIGLNLYPSDLQEYSIKPGFIFKKGDLTSAKEEAFKLASYIYTHRTKSIVPPWESRCIHMNKNVTITEDSNIYKGKFIGLGNFGEALLEKDQKVLKIFNGSLRF